jgi:GAF domain-containing protein/multidrug efflux pump subunit AcrA (membrane-fusion protein)
MPKSTSVDVQARFLSALLQEHEVQPRALLLARQIVEMLPGAAASVYLLEQHGETTNWSSKAVAGDLQVDGTIPVDAGTLGLLAKEGQALLLSGANLVREDYAHLHARRTLLSLAYVPIMVHQNLIGAVEVATFAEVVNQADLDGLVELVEYAAPAFSSATLYQAERNSNLESISRLTQLYDVEKVFNATLEMDELIPIVTAKVRELLEAQAVNLWMVKDENELLLMDRAGHDATCPVGACEKRGEGYVAEVSDSGEPLIISDAGDPRLLKRNSGRDGGIFSAMVAPLVAKGFEVGVIEVINKLNGTPFQEDDLFLLSSIADTAANALNNAGLLQAERKVEILEALVKVSAEITSTLDLDRVLDAIVTGPAAVLPYERAAIALEERGRLKIRAVTGMPRINPEDANVVRLQALLEWVSQSNDAVSYSQTGEQFDDPRPETQAKLGKYFTESGMRGFYAVPLADDDGRVGILSFESSDPNFLGPAHLEMIKILSAQATVALRNASLYREVPFIDLLKPVLDKKRKFLALEKRRRALLVTGAVAALLFLLLFPLPLRVVGDASVSPAQSVLIQPEVEGVVQRVLVREGDAVSAGTVLATLSDWQYRAQLSAAQAKYETAVSQMNRALNSNDGGEAGIQRIQSDYWASELARARERLDRTQLRSPIKGVVATPHVEDLVGRKLMPGDTFAEVVDTSRAIVDVAIDEDDVLLLHSGEKASIKLDGFPTRTFHGVVTVVSPKSKTQDADRYFFARVDVPNPDGAIRDGMQGRGKVVTGWRPAGQVIFRRPAIWIWSKLWSWFGW